MEEIIYNVAEFIVTAKNTSPHAAARELELTYEEIEIAINTLESLGVLGPFLGSEHRELLIKDLEEVNELLSNG